jgi:hypothetical protein
MTHMHAFIVIKSSEGAAAPATYSISGTVYDANGTTAVASATVALGALTATSAADGTYTISDIPAGTSGSLTCTKTGYSWTLITVAAMSGNLTVQNFTNAWWAAGGCGAACVRAYRVKGAGSLANSYINLVNPGTGDAAPGNAPTFNNATGWIFSTDKYLKTGLTIADTNVSAFVLHYGAASQAGYIFGFISDKTFGLSFPFNNDDSLDYFNAGSRRESVTDGFTNGVFGIAGKKGFLNGTPLATAISAGTYTTPLETYIGCQNSSGTPGNFYNKTVGAICFYNTAITDTQAAAVSAAMAALP